MQFLPQQLTPSQLGEFLEVLLKIQKTQHKARARVALTEEAEQNKQ